MKLIKSNKKLLSALGLIAVVTTHPLKNLLEV